MIDSFELILGLIAACFTTFSFAPQALKTIKTKNTEGVSILMYALFLLGVVLWAVYGYVKSDPVIMIANIIIIVFALPVLIIALVNHIERGQ